MIEFLIKRPIAVIMCTLSFCILGALAYFSMPVSLLPDIDIPYISVQISYPNHNARSIENSITKPLRFELSQLSGLKTIKSESREEVAEIFLEFDHSTKTDYAFIEAHEKMDGMISQFPRDLSRPLIIKEKPSDIPAFYINVFPKEAFYRQGKEFHEFSEFIRNSIKMRLEQMEEVSMVDMSGLSYSQIVIEPKPNILRTLGLEYADISRAINDHQIKTESIKFSKGYYTYHLRLLSTELSLERIKKISINKNGKKYRIEDLASIQEEKGNSRSMFIHHHKRAISLAIYKQSESRMQQLKIEMDKTISDLQKQYPDLEFSYERDQSQLLSFSLNNLIQTLVLSMVMAFLMMFLFVRPYKLVAILALSIPLTIIISFFFLQLAHISLNIISLSGLILSVGLMIDNTIIVIDNINQHKGSSKHIDSAIISGTNEIIRPLISSVLTTIAVFLPLITISGLAGALFYDQAIAISISLLCSLLVSILIIPVLYGLVITNHDRVSMSKISNSLLNAYERSMHVLMKRKIWVIIITLLFIPITVLIFQKLEKRMLPEFEEHDLMAAIEWNENISLDQNKKRIQYFLNEIQPIPAQSSAYIGKNEFLLSQNLLKSNEAALLYIDFQQSIQRDELEPKLQSLLHQDYPLANMKIFPSENIFNRIFGEEEIIQQALIRNTESQNIHEDLSFEINSLIQENSYLISPTLETKYNYQISIFHENLLLYHVDYSLLVNKLTILFGGRMIEEIHLSHQPIKIILREPPVGIFESWRSESIVNSKGVTVPLSHLIEIRKTQTPHTIWADQQGEYLSCQAIIPIAPPIFEEILQSLEKKINNIEVSMVDGTAEQIHLFSELIKILIISLLLLYLILAAQFESLFLPFIILLELIFDIAGALLFLYVFGISLNIMSGLGIIVMSGIIINDSIIKIDTIHKSFLKTKDVNLAIKSGGHRRFLPIILTSLTTILALLPLLFFSGMGVDLQLPLAISIIGGLSIGTLVSLYLIPILYYYYSVLISKRGGS